MKAGKNILFLTHHWDYPSRRPYNLGLHLSKLGYNVFMLLPAEKSFCKYKIKHINSNFTLYICPTMLWGGFKNGVDPLDLISRLYFISRLDYDVVYAFDSRPAVILPAVYGKLLKKTPLIIDWTDWFGRGGTITQRSGKLYRFFFEKIETFFEEYFRRYADGYTVICPMLEKRLKALGYTNGIHFFPLGCPPVCDRNIDREVLRDKFNLPADEPLVGCVGTLFPADAELLFESFSCVRKKTTAKLLLIGVNNFRQKYQVPDYAIETGRLSAADMRDYIYCCDIMVIPLKNNIANNGRWPSKLNDYLVTGRPIVSTKLSVITELSRLSAFGELAEDTPADFAGKICCLLNDRERLDLYSKNALQLAWGHLNWPTLVDSLERFIADTTATYCLS